MAEETYPSPDATAEERRRDFLILVAGAMGVVGAAAATYTLVDSLSPSADVLAAGGPVDLDLSKVAAGQQIVVKWRGKPVFVVDRTPDALKALPEPKLVDLLNGPKSEAKPQDPHAENLQPPLL